MSATKPTGILTASTPAFLNHEGEPLFHVADGVPIEDALNWAACFHDIALESIKSVGDGSCSQDGGHTEIFIFAATYLGELTKALLEAVNRGLVSSRKERP